MIIRIVELRFMPDSASLALETVRNIAPKVRESSGCFYLEILVDIRKKGHISTFSKWESEDHLNTYRDSVLFKKFWASIKPHFAEPAKAWSSSSAVYLP